MTDSNAYPDLMIPAMRKRVRRTKLVNRKRVLISWLSWNQLHHSKNSRARPQVIIFNFICHYCSYGTEEIYFSGDGYGTEEEPANEKTTANMDQDESDGCTCRCKDHNHFTDGALQTLVKVERQMCKIRGHVKDKFLLGVLTASQSEAAVTHHAKLLLVLRVHILHLNTQSRTSLYANQCNVAFIM